MIPYKQLRSGAPKKILSTLSLKTQVAGGKRFKGIFYDNWQFSMNFGRGSEAPRHSLVPFY